MAATGSTQAATTLTIAARLETPATGVQLVALLPAGWTVVDSDGGIIGGTGGTIMWPLGDVADQLQASFAPRLRAPLRSGAGQPAFTTTFAARLEHADGVAATCSVTVLVAPALVVAHSVFARTEPVTQAATYLGMDTALMGVLRFDAFRVRFQVRNADLPAASFVPRLQYRVGGLDTFADVPVGGSVLGVPFMSPRNGAGRASGLERCRARRGSRSTRAR